MDLSLERMRFGHEQKGITQCRLVSLSKFMFEGEASWEDRQGSSDILIFSVIRRLEKAHLRRSTEDERRPGW